MNRAGFTRVDLLATTALLGVLACLTMAAASNNRAGSQSAGCMANLRQLTLAWEQYAINEGYFPPNTDDGDSSQGHNWVPGEVNFGGPQQFNSDILADPTRSLLFPYLRHPDASVFRCPAEMVTGKYQGTNSEKFGTTVPAARSYSMNVAVGTDPESPHGKLPTGGAWLDGSHGNTRSGPWRTYGRFDDMLLPSPSQTILLMDEDAYSINDGPFAFCMQTPKLIDWPAARHDMGATVSYADGHVELHHWVDPTTAVVNGNVGQRSVPGNPDYVWLSQRISAPKRP